MKFVKRFAAALSYLTCLPLTSPPDVSDPAYLSYLNGLAKYLPAVGLLIGTILAILSQAITFLNEQNILHALLLVFAWLWITRAIHMDGLMDAADGIFSHRSPERILEIMQDSRVGNFGVLIGVSSLLLKFVCLITLPRAALPVVLILVPAWARFSAAYAIGRFPYLRASGQGKVWHDTMRYPRDLYLAAILPVLATTVLFFVSPRYAFGATVCATIAGITVAHWFNHKLNGHTGDTYGATVEIAEALGLLALCLLAVPPH